MQTLLDDDYMAAVQEIAGYPSVIDARDFAAALDRCARDYGDAAAEALRYYGLIWRVQQNER